MSRRKADVKFKMPSFKYLNLSCGKFKPLWLIVFIMIFDTTSGKDSNAPPMRDDDSGTTATSNDRNETKTGVQTTTLTPIAVTSVISYLNGASEEAGVPLVNITASQLDLHGKRSIIVSNNASSGDAVASVASSQLHQEEQSSLAEMSNKRAGNGAHPPEVLVTNEQPVRVGTSTVATPLEDNSIDDWRRDYLSRLSGGGEDFTSTASPIDQPLDMSSLGRQSIPVKTSGIFTDSPDHDSKPLPAQPFDAPQQSNLVGLGEEAAQTDEPKTNGVRRLLMLGDEPEASDDRNSIVKQDLVSQSRVVELLKLIRERNMVRDGESPENNLAGLMGWHPELDRRTGPVTTFDQAQMFASPLRTTDPNFLPYTPLKFLMDNRALLLKYLAQQQAEQSAQKALHNGNSMNQLDMLSTQESSPVGSNKSNRPNTSESSSGDDQPYTTSNAGKGTSNEKSTGNGDSRGENRHNRIKLSSTTKRPPNSNRNSLISPYSANFDTGLHTMVKTTVVNRPSNNQAGSKDERHQAKEFDQTRGKINKDRVRVGQNKPQSIIYYTTDGAPTNLENYQSDTDSVKILRPEDTRNSVGKQSGGSKKPKIRYKIIKINDNQDGSVEQGPNLVVKEDQQAKEKGGQRDNRNRIEDRQRDLGKEMEKPPKKQIGTNFVQDTNQVYIGSTFKTYPLPQRVPAPRKTPDSDIADKLMKQLQTQRGSHQETRAYASYLDDPHKKALYYTNDPSVPEEPIGSHQAPALTIGDLAQQHGLPFRLKSPLDQLGGLNRPQFFGLNSNPKNDPMESFALTSESGHSTDYTPYLLNNTSQFSLPGPNSPMDSQFVMGDTRIENAHDMSQDARLKFLGLALAKNQLPSEHVALEAAINQATGALENSYKQFLQPQATSSLFQDQSFNARNVTPNSHSDVLASILKQIPQAAYKNPFAAASNHNLSPPPGNFDPMMFPTALGTFENGQAPPMLIQQQDQKMSPSEELRTKQNGLNLVVTDLPNKWALSHMPDLVPIPLAATVPGYLIRLPNGRILAAAITNMFSIQGIEKGSLNPNYKRLLNQRLKNLMKGNGSMANQNYNHNHKNSHSNFASDSEIQPVIIPAPFQFGTQINQLTTQQPKLFLSKHNKERLPTSSPSTGLFGRGVLGQLGFSRQQTASSQHNNQTSVMIKDLQSLMNPKRKPPSKLNIVKLTSSPFPVPNLSEQELASLPIADLNEPVFSFADESQLIDTNPTDFSPPMAESNRNSFISPLNANLDMISAGPQTFPGLGGQLSDYADDLTNPASISSASRVKYLKYILGLKADSMAEDLFRPGGRKRKSNSSLRSNILSRLESIFNSLFTKKSDRSYRNFADRFCKDRTAGRGRDFVAQ